MASFQQKKQINKPRRRRKKNYFNWLFTIITALILTNMRVYLLLNTYFDCNFFLLPLLLFVTIYKKYTATILILPKICYNQFRSFFCCWSDCLTNLLTLAIYLSSIYHIISNENFFFLLILFARYSYIFVYNNTKKSIM